MCKSQAEGGQRCHGHARRALARAEKRYLEVLDGATLSASGRTMLDGSPAPAFHWQTSELEARYELEDARARYASTPKGEADLTVRMTQQTVWADRRKYSQALSEGLRMRQQSANIACDARAGRLTGAQAANLAKFPTERTLQNRQAEFSRANSIDGHELAGYLSATRELPGPPEGWIIQASKRWRNQSSRAAQ